MRITPNFTSESFDKLSKTQNNSSINHIKYQPQKNKANSITTDCGIFAGFILGIIGLIKGVKLINKPSKKTLVLLEDKLGGANATKDIANTKVEEHFKTAKKELSDAFSVPYPSTEEISDFAAKITNAISKKELIQLEESYFDKLTNWFEKNIDADKKTPDELTADYNKITEKFKKNVTPIEKSALNKIDSDSEISKEIRNKRRNKDVLVAFDVDLEDIKNAITKNKTNKLNKIKETGQDLFREYNNYSKNIVSNKNNETKNILKLAKEKLVILTNSKMPLQKDIDESLNLEIIPADMPKSILENSFYKFASNSNEKELDKSIPDFVKNMGEKQSLKDIQTLIKRLELRQNAGSDANSVGWYGAKVKQLKNCESKISKYLENSFYNSGKDIVPGTYSNIYPIFLTVDQENAIIFSLQEHAKKMGFSTVDRMISHFSMGDVLQESDLEKNHSDRMKNFLNCPIGKVYPEIKDKINDFSWLLNT